MLLFMSLGLVGPAFPRHLKACVNVPTVHAAWVAAAVTSGPTHSMTQKSCLLLKQLELKN